MCKLELKIVARTRWDPKRSGRAQACAPGCAVNERSGGNVIQSSLYGNEVPERAIDGNRASNLGQGSCTHTKKDLKPWWRLDLLKTYQISNVTITNRGDCCAWRIDGAEIRIGNSLDDNELCASGSSQTFVCNGMEGRYVNIVIPGRQEYLTLCEVEVTGQALGNTAPTGDLYHLT
uniref:Fucolectin tachylectin-4 pentraxin-1 domain-containing protein n=1 Tax=Sander lucioperca TaxID=283035 RepID=A0A8C9ZPU4_SANLU